MKNPIRSETQWQGAEGAADRTIEAPLFLTGPHPSVRECYRLIAHRLDLRPGAQSGRVILVTSPGAKDGKTTTALHLGHTLAEERGLRVVVVDAHRSAPFVATAVGLRATVGIGHVVAGEATLEEALWRVGSPRLHVLCATAGDPRLARPTDLGPLLHSLRSQCDCILLDTPAVADSADAALLAGCADGILLVVKALSTRRGDLAATLAALDGAPVVGCVVNDPRGVIERGTAHFVTSAPGPAPSSVATEDE